MLATRGRLAQHARGIGLGAHVAFGARARRGPQRGGVARVLARSLGLLLRRDARFLSFNLGSLGRGRRLGLSLRAA